MKRLISFLKSSMLRWWFMITAILTVSSACPCCGKPVCPVGVGGSAILAGIMVIAGKIFMFLRNFASGLFKQSQPSGRISSLK